MCENGELTLRISFCVFLHFVENPRKCSELELFLSPIMNSSFPALRPVVKIVFNGRRAYLGFTGTPSTFTYRPTSPLHLIFSPK